MIQGDRAARAASIMRLERIIIVVSTLVVLTVITVLTAVMLVNYQTQKAVDVLKSMQGSDPCIQGSDPIEINGDMVGWLTIPGTSIDFPVVQRIDEPEFYLRRDFWGNDSRGGTLFMSASSSVSKPTYNWLIYGHNMYNGSMFHDLVKYKRQEFYEAHPTFIFDNVLEDGKGTYEVIAAVMAVQGGDEAFDYEQYAGGCDAESFWRYLREVRKRSLYETPRAAQYGDQLITLSTCEYSQKYGRFYVVAVRVS